MSVNELNWIGIVTLSHAKEGPESCIEVSETKVDERVPNPLAMDIAKVINCVAKPTWAISTS